MSDFETLRSRVEEAAENLASAEAERHRHAESLSGLLASLEEKFTAQRQELAYYKQRVAPLEDINHQLAGLMDRLLSMIDQGFGEASVAPIKAAAETASRILESVPAADAALMGEPETESEPESEATAEAEAEDAAAVLEDVIEAEPETGFDIAAEFEPELEPEPEPESLDGLAAEAGAMEAIEALEAETGDAVEIVAPESDDETTVDGGFEDVGLDALIAEAEAEEELEAGLDLPDAVVDAHRVSVEDGDPLAEMLNAIAAVDAEQDAMQDMPEAAQETDAGAGAPADDVVETMEALARQIAAETAESGGAGTEKADIRSLLARVEAAVEEVRARVERAPAAAQVQEAEDEDEHTGPSSAVA
jgi:hypothetical protein